MVSYLKYIENNLLEAKKAKVNEKANIDFER